MSVVTFLLLLTPLALVFAAWIVWPLVGRRGDGASAISAASAGSLDGRTEADPDVGAAGSAAAEDRRAATNRAVVAERRAQLDEELSQLPPDSPERSRRIAEFTRTALADLGEGTTADAATIAEGSAGARVGRGAATATTATTTATRTTATAEAEAAPVATARAPRSRGVLVAVLLVVLLAVPLVGYRLVGTPEWPGIIASRQTEEKDVRAMLAEVERRLAERPDDAQGWLLLGRSRIALGEGGSGLEALERALSIDSKEPVLAAQIRIDLADALARADTSGLAGRPTTLVREALVRVPNHPKGLALAGAFAAAAGDAGEAGRYWRQLLAELPPGSEPARQIEAMLAQLPDASASASANANANGEGNDPGDGTPKAAAAGPRLTGRVELGPGLAERVAPDDTVFIAARALDPAGEPVGPPVAVVRVRAAALPYAFSLDDAAAMTPAAKLSGAPRVRVVARVSRSGGARPVAGDIEGSTGPLAHDATEVVIRLDRVVP